MEFEISNLRADLSQQSTTIATHKAQISALEEKLAKAERAAGAAQRELLDARRNLDRASEKAVKEGSERTSAETRLRALTREADEARKSATESAQRVEVLEKKLQALTTLHKESDARRQNEGRERERAERELADLRRRVGGLERENERLKKRNVDGPGGDDGFEELEDEERTRLKVRVRDLEGEVYDLRKGVWREKKKSLGGAGDDDATSPGGFEEVDLSGAGRRGSVKRGQGFTDILSSGFSALTGGGAGTGVRESLDLLDDDDMGFDEDAFRKAHEEEARKRVERVRDVKRGLKDWEGWRLDLVDLRLGGGGAGEIFDV
jgi:hypothetical protein